MWPRPHSVTGAGGAGRGDGPWSASTRDDAAEKLGFTDSFGNLEEEEFGDVADFLVESRLRHAGGTAPKPARQEKGVWPRPAGWRLRKMTQGFETVQELREGISGPRPPPGPAASSS